MQVAQYLHDQERSQREQHEKRLLAALSEKVSPRDVPCEMRVFLRPPYSFGFGFGHKKLEPINWLQHILNHFILKKSCSSCSFKARPSHWRFRYFPAISFESVCQELRFVLHSRPSQWRSGHFLSWRLCGPSGVLCFAMTVLTLANPNKNYHGRRPCWKGRYWGVMLSL